MFRDNSNTFMWTDYHRHLTPGHTYRFRVRMQTVGTPLGQWTDPIDFELAAEVDGKSAKNRRQYPEYLGFYFDFFPSL